MTSDQNTLSCVAWDGGRADDTVCRFSYLLDSTFPKTPVNPDSRHLSAALISADYNDGMLLVFEDISNVVNIMWRSFGGSFSSEWHNITNQTLSEASETYETTATRGNLQLTGTCSPSLSTAGRWLYCFTKNGTASTLGIIGLEFTRDAQNSSGLEGPEGPGESQSPGHRTSVSKRGSKLTSRRRGGLGVERHHRIRRWQIQGCQPNRHYHPRWGPSDVDQQNQSARRPGAWVWAQNNAGAKNSVSVSADGQRGDGEWDPDACVSSVEWLRFC